MTKQQEALQIAGRFLRLQAMGYVATPNECKTISDLCFICLPMKYRLDKNDLKAMESQCEHNAAAMYFNECARSRA